jgi:hypothetical protein
MMLVLRVLAQQPLHGYVIAQPIRQLSAEELTVEEGSFYPALQKLWVNGWVKVVWRESESGREVRISPHHKRPASARDRSGGVPAHGQRDWVVDRWRVRSWHLLCSAVEHSMTSMPQPGDLSVRDGSSPGEFIIVDAMSDSLVGGPYRSVKEAAQAASQFRPQNNVWREYRAQNGRTMGMHVRLALDIE